MNRMILGLVLGTLVSSQALADHIKFEDVCKAELASKLSAIFAHFRGHTGSPTSTVKLVGQQVWTYDTFTSGMHTATITAMFLITDDDGWTWNAIGRSEGTFTANKCELKPIKIESLWTCNKNIPCEK